MARRLIDCVGKAVKAGRLNENEAALLLQRTERFAHLTKEQAELNAANSVLTEQMTELSNLEKQVGPPGKAEVVYKSKDKDAAMAMMFHEAQVVTENKMLAKQREVEGEGAIKTQRQVAVEQEMQAIIKEPVPEGETKPGTHEARLQVYGKIKEKLTGLIGRHAAEIAKLEFKAGMTIGTSEGLTAEEIATQEIDKSKLGEIDKAKLLSALGELDALLKYLPAEVRGRVGGFYQLAKGSMGEKTLTEFFTKRIRMVEREFERVLVKEYREVLGELLKSTKPRRRENKVRSSTLGPDVQDEMDLARRASVLNAAQVADTLDKIETALQKEGLSDEARGDLMEEWAIVNAFGDLQHRNAEDLAAAYEWLAGEAKSGREQWQAKEEARREKTRGRVEKVLTGLPKATEAGLAKLEKKDLASIARQIVLSHFSYQQFLEHVLPETAAFKKEWADRARRADVKTQDQALDAGNRLTAALQGVVGSKGRMAMANALYSLKEVHANAVQKDGEAFPMSKLHAVQYLLSWAQPDVREKMINTGWKQESIDQMVALTSDDKSQAVMAFLRKEYADTYKLLNPVYRRMFGMNMPRIENYAPTYYETTKTDVGMDPFGSPMAGSGLTPGLLKARVAHGAKIRHVDALSAYWQHVGHAYHWANYAELMREMRGVLNDTEVFGAIKQKHGQPVGELVNNWLDALGRQGMSKAADITWVTRMIDGLVGAKAVSTLGLNLRSVAMQTDSAMRAILAVPMRRIMGAMTDRNFISNVAAAWKSDTVQRRVMSGGTPEAKYLFERTQFKPSMLLELARYSMVPMQWTDGFLTSISSAIVYTDAYNEAVKSGVAAPQAEAMAADAMDEAVYRYSQPVGLSAKSLTEVSGHSITKMFMLFMSDPRLKTALMADSFISLAKGQGKAGDHVRRLVGIEAMSLVSLLIQNLYRDAFSDEEDDEIWTMGGLIRALTLPMLSGWFVLGTVAEIGITTAIGEKAFEPSRDPTIDAWKRANRAFTHLDDLFDTDDPNAMLREWDNIARGAALAGGVSGPIGAAPGVGLSVLVNVLKPLVGAYENVQKEE